MDGISRSDVELLSPRSTGGYVVQPYGADMVFSEVPQRLYLYHEIRESSRYEHVSAMMFRMSLYHCTVIGAVCISLAVR